MTQCVPYAHTVVSECAHTLDCCECVCMYMYMYVYMHMQLCLIRTVSVPLNNKQRVICLSSARQP